MTIESEPSAKPARPGFLEICVESVADARAAIAGGADQLEVCSALALGGLTPSAGLVAAVVAIASDSGIPVRAMVRPRPGDFSYDDDMLATAIAESRHLLQGGVDGLVFGAVQDGKLCERSLTRWRDAVRTSAGGAATGLTLHRAIDVVSDPVAAVDTAIGLGFDQVLTSGGAPTASEGAACLAAMRVAADARLRVVAASGVTPTTLAPLLAATGLCEAHASARSRKPAPGDHPFGFGDTPSPVDPDVVRRLRAILDGRLDGKGE